MNYFSSVLKNEVTYPERSFCLIVERQLNLTDFYFEHQDNIA